MVAGGGVEADDVAAVAPDAHQRVETIELGEHGLERRLGPRVVGRPGRQRDLGAHRRVRALDEMSGGRRGLRPHAAVSAPDMARAQAARRTAIVTARARRARGLEADRLPCV